MLRELLAGADILLAPGCSDAVTSRLVELAGFGAVYGSGSAAHQSWGLPDANILTMTEMGARYAAISETIDIPLIADAETGFGNVVNVVRTVREYERAGVAALHIEDHLIPKRSAYIGYAGETITRREFVDKIRAAVDARRDETLIIVARTEATESLEEAIERVAECLGAGADVGWVSLARTPEVICTVRRTVDKPLMGVLPGGMTGFEYGEAGANCGVVPNALQVAALCAQRLLLEDLKRTGTPIPHLSGLPGFEEMNKFFRQQGVAELREIEERYAR
jgi:2-methylisocitrate lyase-like PEP mutase family enzyme